MFSKKSNQKILWLVIIIIIVIVALIIFNFYKKTEAEPKEQPLPPDQTQEKELPAEVYSYVGKITQVADDYILIQASATRNYLISDTLLTVKFDARTRFDTLYIPQTLTGNPAQDKMVREEITQTDLKVGQTVMVTSPQNIRGVSEFTADRIEVQMVR